VADLFRPFKVSYHLLPCWKVMVCSVRRVELLTDAREASSLLMIWNGCSTSISIVPSPPPLEKQRLRAFFLKFRRGVFDTSLRKSHHRSTFFVFTPACHADAPFFPLFFGWQPCPFGSGGISQDLL